MKPNLLFLTNLYNSDPEEDLFISQYLRDHFNIIISHPSDCLDIEDNVDVILIRNIWPIFKVYQKDKIIRRFIKKSLGVYNSLSGRGNMCGKNYLISLYKKNFPVIPSINKLKEIDLLGKNDYYFIKPIQGENKIDCEKIKKKELFNRNLEGYIIQPYIDFKYEVSFYFIDNKIQYVLYAPDKKNRWNLKPYKPLRYEIELAKKFINWNTLKYGIQRIDMCKTKDDKLLLMEVEDDSPFLSLLDIKKEIRKKFLDNLIKSIKKNCL